MDLMFYCFWCKATKTATDLQQQVLEETCVYVCPQCGTPEGSWLRRQGDWSRPRGRRGERPDAETQRDNAIVITLCHLVDEFEQLTDRLESGPLKDQLESLLRLFDSVMDRTVGLE